MKSFNNYLFILASAGFVATACFGGNQELVELKTAELCSINEQITKQAAPDGLKEGESVEIKATMRVERSPDKGPIVRDLNVESVKVSNASDVVLDGIAAPADGSEKIRESDAAEKKPMAGTPGFRQECLNVPTVN